MDGESPWRPTLLVSAVSGGSAITLALLVLAGWQLGVSELRMLIPGAPPTTPLTALMLLLLGCALEASRRSDLGNTSRWLWLCCAISAIVVAADLFIAAEYAFELGSLIDGVMYADALAEQSGSYPGRPSPQTVTTCLLVAFAIGLSPFKVQRVERTVSALAFAGLVIPWLALFGYASTTPLLYAVPDAPQTGMSPLTAIGFLMLVVGTAGLRPAEGLFAVIPAASSGGRLVRALLPVALLLPVLLAWGVNSGRISGLFTTSMGFAISWGLTSLLFAVLVSWQGVVLHRYDAALKQHSEALERSNRELQQFAYVASHDLQAPLRSISGFAQMLREKYEGQLDAEADDWIDRVVRNALRMQNMIRDILAYADVDSRARSFEPVALDAVLDEVLTTLDGSIRDSGARVAREALPTILGDHSQLTQLLQNLVGNALKYHGAKPPRVLVSAELRDREWLIFVRDSGIGIEPQHRERVFEIFRRLHTQRSYPGTGIGLAICRRVVERHGGRIWVDSTPGEGSTFYFTLPRGKGTPV